MYAQDESDMISFVLNKVFLANMEKGLQDNEKCREPSKKYLHTGPQ